MICKVCGSLGNNKEFKIKEMMFGFRDGFALFSLNAVTVINLFQQIYLK